MDYKNKIMYPKLLQIIEIPKHYEDQKFESGHSHTNSKIPKIVCGAISKSGTFLVVATVAKIAYIYYRKDDDMYYLHELYPCLYFNDQTTQMKFDPDQRFIVVADSASCITHYQLPSASSDPGSLNRCGNSLEVLRGNSYKMLVYNACTFTDFEISQTGDKLFSVEKENQINVFSYSNYNTLENTLSGHSNLVSCLRALSDGRLLSAGGDGFIVLWNIKEGTEITRHQCGKGGIKKVLTVTDTHEKLDIFILYGLGKGLDFMKYNYKEKTWSFGGSYEIMTQRKTDPMYDVIAPTFTRGYFVLNNHGLQYGALLDFEFIYRPISLDKDTTVLLENVGRDQNGHDEVKIIPTRTVQIPNPALESGIHSVIEAAKSRVNQPNKYMNPINTFERRSYEQQPYQEGKFQSNYGQPPPIYNSNASNQIFYNPNSHPVMNNQIQPNNGVDFLTQQYQRDPFYGINQAQLKQERLSQQNFNATQDQRNGGYNSNNQPFNYDNNSHF
uniref:WD_REPEATS_REGION domain-containing protein n=1 Tax=Rhabditophanes sp. KR3021 TaxID=114890 RepID=A0AC35UCG9_9BILA